MTKARREQIRAALGVAIKPRKYRNRKSGGFDSVKEAERWNVLVAREHGGAIADLRKQVRFELVPKQLRDDGLPEKPVQYVADFVYVEDGRRVVEDVKSPMTRRLKDYIIKRKLMLWVHGITIREV